MLLTRLHGRRVALGRMPTGFGPDVWVAEVQADDGRPLLGNLPGTGRHHTLLVPGSSIGSTLDGVATLLPTFEAAA